MLFPLSSPLFIAESKVWCWGFALSDVSLPSTLLAREGVITESFPAPGELLAAEAAERSLNLPEARALPSLRSPQLPLFLLLYVVNFLSSPHRVNAREFLHLVSTLRSRSLVPPGVLPAAGAAQWHSRQERQERQCLSRGLHISCSSRRQRWLSDLFSMK